MSDVERNSRQSTYSELMNQFRLLKDIVRRTYSTEPFCLTEDALVLDISKIAQIASPLYSGSSSNQKIRNWFSIKILTFLLRIEDGCKIYKINDFRDGFPRN